MKRIIFFIPLLLLFWKIDAQTGVCYEYDAAGNRTFRHDCMSMLASEEQHYSDHGSIGIGKIETAQVQGELIVFPNPTKGAFQLQTNDFQPESDVSIFDINGKLLLKRKLNDGQFDLTDYPAGTYYMNIVSESVSKTIVIAKSDR
ncbi:MAG TPA: T9SS type A sorting domain-containing protein [Saprospiraceae bacterium]|nr:T9SS type A sorting domain-containing protein [Saprospiraceae bacterium]HMP25217.1 T9SS type A sorting domain-containing protein [Saprospiraceae bacterium]